MKEKEVLVKRKNVSRCHAWIKEFSNSQHTVKEGTAFVKSIPRLEIPWRDDVLADKYCSIIGDYVKKGYARNLTPEEASVPTPKQWFQPYHPARNSNKSESW